MRVEEVGKGWGKWVRVENWFLFGRFVGGVFWWVDRRMVVVLIGGFKVWVGW